MRVQIGWSSLPAILCLLYLIGCVGALVMYKHEDAVMKRFTPQHAESEARTYVDLLRANQFDRIEKDLDPSVVGDDKHGQLTFMASLFPPQQPKSIKVVGVHATRNATLSGATFSDLSISLEYEFPGKWLLVNLTTRNQNGAQTIVGFQADELTDSLEHRNRLTLVGKGLEQYVILFMFLVDMGLTFYALVLCVKTGVSKKDWFWPILCLIGVGRFAVNWTTGEASFTPVWIGFPPAGANSLLYSPWTVYAAVPLGAVLFLLFRRSGPHGAPAPSPVSPTDNHLPDAPADQPDLPTT